MVYFPVKHLCLYNIIIMHFKLFHAGMCICCITQMNALINVVYHFTDFTGPIDYLKGDGPNQQVRAAASVSLKFWYLILSMLLIKVNICWPH